MVLKTIPSITIIAAVLMLLISAFAGTAAAAHDPKDPDHDNVVSDTLVGENKGLQDAHEETNKAAATRVRKAFLQAKKAFHEARPEIQAIKKGDESPVEDVPSFFESEDDDDSNNDEDFQDGSDPELST